jgi:hypothetical protein
MHAASEAEGSARRICAESLESETSFRCDVTRSSDGDVVRTTVAAVRPLNQPGGRWSSVTRDELSTGVPDKGDALQARIDPGDVYFMRTVEVVHSRTFLTVAQEMVKAPSPAAADAAWAVPPADLESITTDPELVTRSLRWRPPAAGGVFPAAATAARGDAVTTQH